MNNADSSFLKFIIKNYLTKKNKKEMKVVDNTCPEMQLDCQGAVENF